MDRERIQLNFYLVRLVESTLHCFPTLVILPIDRSHHSHGQFLQAKTDLTFDLAKEDRIQGFSCHVAVYAESALVAVCRLLPSI